ncbi:MAG: PHP domain-containing protein [Clostridia bacterium]|nr:PHP domain-containing protein [Clostridia bacterium]
MKRYLLPETGTDYKANLHCHSTLSDGKLTPEEIKDAYRARGYAIVAYTDHDVLIPHNDLAEADFLPLNGYELAVSDKNDTVGRTCHFCFIARDPDNFKQECVYPSRYLPEGTEAPFAKHYTPACISSMMQTGRDAGFFVTYNHPSWSQERYPEYTAYHGMHAMEMVNFGCKIVGYDDTNSRVYDDMLRAGERIYCVATDDNHNKHPLDSRHCDSFGGFTMIRADKLEYRTITDALFAGNFYASEGPTIGELWLEDNTVHITCSPADRITLTTDFRRACIALAEDALLTEANFTLSGEEKYFRLTVVDAGGRMAFTNAYFVD